MTKHTETASQTGQVTNNNGKVLSGVVVSAKMQDTVVVAVTRFVKHPKYHKFMKLVKRYHVHDPGNSAELGARVEIRETRPISKRKHFALVTPAK